MSEATSAEAATRQALTAATFVEIVDTLVGEFDVIDVLTVLTSRCVELLAASAAGILLVDTNHDLRVVGASTEAIQLLELFQIQNDEGPCLDCFNSGDVVLHSDIDVVSRWPSFGAECTRAGFSSVCAVPLRLRARVIGCLNMFISGSGGLSRSDVALAQALADVASIAIIQDQSTRHRAIREGQLRHALDSRIAIEQAKGIIAERNRLDMDDAFKRLRTLARNSNRGLTDVAEAIIAGSVTAADVVPAAPPPPPQRRQT